MEIRGEPVNQENNNEEIERVERPSQKGCRYRVGLARGRKPGHSAVAPFVKQRCLPLVPQSHVAKYRDRARRRKPRTLPAAPIPQPSAQGKICRSRTVQRTPWRNPVPTPANSGPGRASAEVPERARRCAAIPRRAAALCGKTAAKFPPARRASAE